MNFLRLSIVALISSVQIVNAAAPKNFTEIVRSNLKFVAAEQVKEKNHIYVAGEWPTYIESTVLPVAVGVGKPIGKNHEASAFTTASVANQLASLYLEHPEVREYPEVQAIPQLIAQAVPSFERYREGTAYNFYPPKLWKGKMVRQPIDMTLFRIWKGFTNIPVDADTSSSVYATLLHHANLSQQPMQMPEEILRAFSHYRDRNRSSHYYNRGEKRRNTQAFMTWLADENNPNMPRFWFAAPERGARIPFNKNDVDCIVNLNVLRMLALAKTDIEGRAQACRMINDMVKKEEHAACGIYYPNTFNMAFSMAETKKAGETCFEEARTNQMVEFILKNQSEDGGWDNVNNIWIDRVQSTIFAMTALLEFGDTKDRRIESSLVFGMRFLLKNLKTSKDGHLYWPGEVFFTATAIARSLVVWRSHSYTTTSGAAVLLKFQKAYPGYTMKYFR